MREANIVGGRMFFRKARLISGCQSETRELIGSIFSVPLVRMGNASGRLEYGRVQSASAAELRRFRPKMSTARVAGKSEWTR